MAGLTQTELSERTGRDRSVIARREQGVISPPVESLLVCVQACGYDISLVLVPLDESADREIRDELQARGVSFVVIGAFARVIHGTGEVTDGLDVIPSIGEENLSRLAKALDDLDARRADGKELDLARVREPVVELDTRAGELKLVPEPAGGHGYDDLRRHASREPLGRGVRPQVASRGDLARLRKSFRREPFGSRLVPFGVTARISDPASRARRSAAPRRRGRA